MRIGIFGGTFDPVHYGHLLLAEQCREQVPLEQVWFIPAAIPPHKRQAVVSAAKDRLAMLQLATAGYPEFVVSDLEIARGGASFTVDTLTQLSEADPHRDLYLLIGGDSLAEFSTWREPARILELAKLAVVNRGRAHPNLASFTAALGDSAASRIELIQMPAVDLSATDMRDRVASGKSIRYMTPRAVERYLLEHALYRPAE